MNKSVSRQRHQVLHLVSGMITTILLKQTNQHPLPLILTMDTELDNYLHQPRVNRSSNIYAYWHCSQFPLLEPAAKKYLSAPATSVASERLFSAAGQIYAD